MSNKNMTCEDFIRKVYSDNFTSHIYLGCQVFCTTDGDVILKELPNGNFFIEWQDNFKHFDWRIFENETAKKFVISGRFRLEDLPANRVLECLRMAHNY